MDELIFEFNLEKSRVLKETRGVSFEEAIALLDKTHILDILEHPNQQKYPHQKIYVLNFGEYVYLIPFVREGNRIFLKTIIPSRKATETYLRKRGD